MGEQVAAGFKRKETLMVLHTLVFTSDLRVGSSRFQMTDKISVRMYLENRILKIILKYLKLES